MEGSDHFELRFRSSSTRFDLLKDKVTSNNDDNKMASVTIIGLGNGSPSIELSKQSTQRHSTGSVDAANLAAYWLSSCLDGHASCSGNVAATIYPFETDGRR